MTLPCLYIKQTNQKGRGIFTEENLTSDTIVEIAPVIVMSNKDRKYLDKTLLHDYIFEWGHNKEECCMALGCVPIYNHSYTSNCEYIMDYGENNIIIKTVKDIALGEELTINYNGDSTDKTEVWFKTTF